MKETIHHPFYEAEPTVREALSECVPTKDDTIRFLESLFPCASWLPRYNWRWFVGDSIAGFTVGLVVIPQSMAYALLATLPPDFGLYTSFAGAATYWLFGTSKDIVIGTTAVGSLLVSEVISHVHEAHPNTYSSVEIAKTLSFVTGLILFLMGFLRLGWLVEVIPYIPVSAFITAASIIIMCTQLPVLLGIPGVNTREEPYKVLISTFRSVGDTKLDAAIGITCLLLLELVKFVFTTLEARQPARKRLWSILSSLRLTFAMLLYTLVSFLVNRNLSADESKFRIVGHINQGFVHVGTPSFNAGLIGAILPQSPIILIILIVEHIAIAKSFGKKLGYEVAPSQEIMAQGTANILGPFLGGYSCTGSFGASAVLSKAGVKTPLAGLFSAFMLLLALYALTGVFYFIPRAALAGLIIHAVFSLVATPSTVLKYWYLSPLECMIWVAGVVMAIFTGLETAIYVTTGLSFLLLLVRIARTRGQFLGRVTIQEMDQSEEGLENTTSEKQTAMREIFLDLDRNDASNRDIVVETPHGGVLIYHFPEGLNYLNQAQHLKTLTDYVYTHTKRSTEEPSKDNSETLWCDNPVLHKHDDDVPVLRAIVIDCSTIHNIDITSVQGLVDIRNALDRWASPSIIEWHFGGLRNRWARRALTAAGFGRSAVDDYHTVGSWAPVLPLASEEPETDDRNKQICADDENTIGTQNGDVRSPDLQTPQVRILEKRVQSAVMTSLLSGAVFGTGLTLSGVASPQVIKNQFNLSDFHMAATFLTASATSAVVFAAYNSRKADKSIPPRSASSQGWLGTYDGNIIGGAMIGLGISLTGACPGTVLVQATAGVQNSRVLACSCLLAGVIWVKLKPLITGSQPPSRTDKESIMAVTGWSTSKVVIIYEAAMVSVLAAILAYAPRSVTLLHPVVGGLLIGVGQLSSVILTKKPVGVSGAYGEFGNVFWSILGGRIPKTIPDSIFFAGGLMAGSWIAMFNVPTIREIMLRSESPSLFTAVLSDED
ncbi:hypothetical protein FGRMN_2957 [Fusarium graminum]|nr:hypothetical protein FGRMN_2957 [Fusarium graminum]